MGRGGKVNSKRNFKDRVRSKDKGSDDSDEDYVVEIEENVSDDDSEDLGNSLDEYASEESFGSFVEEEEEEFRKIVRSKNNKGSRANGKIGAKASRKRQRVCYEEEEEDEGDEDYVNDDDDDDEEFSPDDEDEFLDEDEELTTKKKTNNMKVGKRNMQNRGSRRGRKKRRKSRVSKKPLANKGRNNRRLRKKERCEFDDEYEGEFIDDSAFVRARSSKNSSARSRYAVYSDSDFMSSGSSDYEYTISEEEREQVREGSKLFGVKTSLRSSSSIRKTQESGDLCQQGKSLARKGKEKVKEVKPELGKQMCGICLSEEDKRRLRGTLDCCSHYFCFTCIMEWSKVESRCPLCKQRFKTITKNGRAAVGVEPRNVVIQVPKRDQVYQPSEEEIRSFIDPYENVICTECHEGGEDGLMLLCDLCDSPAHTFCVGLGRQVPEGNWYCEVCRPVALGSTSSQALDPMPDQRTTNNIFSRPSPDTNSVEGFDATSEPSPRLAFAPGFGSLSSPRFPAGDVQAASPVSGAGGSTLSQRRQLHRHIQNLISMSRMHYMANRTDGISAANLHIDLSNPHNDQCRETIVQNSRTQEIGASQSTFLDERLEANDYPSSSMQNGDLFSSRSSQMRTQALQDPVAATAARPVNLTLWPELPMINSIPVHGQFHQCNSGQGMASEVNLSPCRAREESQFYVVKEQLQSMVQSHLKSLSQDIDLDLSF
ncbi:uncharacterized protein LOC8287135 isoform X2 [Ricinus communis]|uniref:uncharacterized protein LOC8287135 isoform X2 n=1 Tax=Ricinus communis TaxID=3988 RepID=UPI00077260E3|nr:uncharacterized protein LOC8287135 isoform X2 [Ricinus communis]|eukprot:XP_015570620.1 uncharacterized protein LOC8287135 isoform X2 [Ricinus communis]